MRLLRELLAVGCCMIAAQAWAGSDEDLLSLSLAPTLTAQPPGKVVVPPGTKIERNLEYVKGGHERHRLDIYTPAKGNGPFPVLIWLHGGAWTQGSKDPCYAAPLVAKGYVAVSMNYRLLQHAEFPAQIEDCKAAVRWLRANAKKYNLDPDRIGAWGSSAGAHLASLLGTSGHVKELEGKLGNLDQSSHMQAVLDMYGPLRITKDTTNQSNPMTHINKDVPPFLIVHGDADMAVPIKGSEQFAAALKKAGGEATFFTVKGAGHNGPQFWTDQMMTMYQGFFDKHLKKAASK